MLRRIFLPTILIVLGYGFWMSPDFKEIAAGVAIFLFGMLSLEEGFKKFSGGLLERILQKSTDKLYKSIGFGIVATTVMQSSSLVSVLTISFLGAGLIGLAQGIGIVFGANIGTTTGAWLVAGFGLKVNIAAYAMPMLVFGIIFIFQKSKSLKGIGYILAGLGFLFLGIHYMKDGFEAFKSTIDLAAFGGVGLKYLFIFTGVGVFATVVMQSSHATLVLIITALSVGQISYENALALAIGANVGTTITAIIGAMSSNIVGKQLAGAHLIFNVVTGLIAIIFMHQIMWSVDEISAFVGIAQDDYTLKLAVFHTIFNVIGVLVMIPFINKLVVFLEKTLKSKEIKEIESYDTAQFLNESVLEIPTTAMSAILRETKHLYLNAFEIITHGLNLKRGNIMSEMPLEAVVKDSFSSSAIDINHFYDHRIKGIYGEIIDFATLAQSEMLPEDISRLYALKLASRDIVEAVKDTKHLQKNLLKYNNNLNRHIQEQYDGIKIGLAELLRSIDRISMMDDEAEIIVLLSKAKVHMQRYDILANGTLDNLIRKNLITNEMATSLMNDSSYAYEISKHLIAMAEIIFIDSLGDIKNVGEDMIISDEDVNTILAKG
ncbi:MAG: phosphate:Na+ symporter [Sulfurimonas sp.]|jgi:phosphate:Na+ symporter|uniref:Na/Pi cotransporter family protein n=1 Tax=Sulfurimonas sp. TaxID=2022749 RepID=UPI0039E5CA2C